ncbi:MAG TPA: hypothetical protein VK213_12665 [Bacteroidales bacterium]|nr:hypothetical protein [Bacteroidales bacterium]
MRHYLIILLYISGIFLFSCEEDSPFINCDECLQTEPLNATVILKLDERRNAIVPVEVYSGFLEENINFASFRFGSPQAEIQLPLNSLYTITATYTYEGRTYTAVDTAYPRVKFSEDQCDDPCYYVYDNVADLRIKYPD